MATLSRVVEKSEKLILQLIMSFKLSLFNENCEFEIFLLIFFYGNLFTFSMTGKIPLRRVFKYSKNTKMELKGAEEVSHFPPFRYLVNRDCF